MKIKILAISASMLLCTNRAVILSATNHTDNTVSLEELIDHSDLYDGRTVAYEGEAIGNILNRGKYAWINVSDGSNSAIGIYMTEEQADKISLLGHYETVGDRIRIQGIFHEACNEHGGDLDIHAETVEVIEKGRTEKEEVSQSSVLIAVGAAAAAITLVCFALHRSRCYNSASL